METFHNLRHSHASLLIAQGEHPKVIQARLGRAQITTTLDRYGLLLEGLDTDTARRLDRAMKRSGSTQPKASECEESAGELPKDSVDIGFSDRWALQGSNL